jgi:hypothetical protein
MKDKQAASQGGKVGGKVLTHWFTWSTLLQAQSLFAGSPQVA